MEKKLAASGAANVPSVIGAANVPVCEAAEKLVFGFGKALRASADGDVCHSVIVDVCRSFFLADGDVCHFIMCH